MFAVGHMAVGYLIAKAVQKPLKTQVNLPLVFFLSLIPDVDLLIKGLVHRTVTHSLVFEALLFVPIFVVYRKRSLPYFAALVSHSIVGDFLTGEGAEMFWPLSSEWFGLGFEMREIVNLSAEWLTFAVAMIVLVKTKDIRQLLAARVSNLILVVPSGVIVLSAFAGYGKRAPTELLIPHVAFLVLFVYSIMKYLYGTGSLEDRKASG